MRKGFLLLAAALAAGAQAQITGSLTDFAVDIGGQVFDGPVAGASFGDLQPFGGGSGTTGGAAASGVTNYISWVIWDGYGAHGNSAVGNKHDLRDFGGQQFDVKALYMKNDFDYLYVGVVTGFNPAGIPDPYGRPRTYRVGDLAINPDWPNKTADFGVILPTASAGSAGSASIVAGGKWHTPDKDVGFGPPALSNYKSDGTLTGASADFIYAAVNYSGGPVTYYDPVTHSNQPLHLLEARIALDDIGLSIGDSVDVSWAVSCNNDFLGGTHTLAAVPEPSSLAGLAGAAGLCLAALRRRRAS